MAAQQARKRPWYLVAALLGSLALGLSGGYRGCEVWAIYHGQIDRPALVAGYSSEADRDAVGAAWDRWLDAYDVSAPRQYPIGVALLLVSATLVFFAMRGMAGRGSARNVLVQLVLVQAAIYVAEFFLTKNIRSALLDVSAARAIAEAHESAANPEAERMMPSVMQVVRWFPALYLAARTFGSALIVYALTRQRSREFFEATSDPAVEQ